MIITDPRTDSQPLRESSYVNLPVIAFCDSDSPLKYVNVAIPANNKGKLSIGLLYWMLAREVLRLRGAISRTAAWDVPVDLFFYRDPEEIEDKTEEAAADDFQPSNTWGDAGASAAYSEPLTYEAPASGDDWNAVSTPAAAGGWDGEAAAGATGEDGWESMEAPASSW